MWEPPNSHCLVPGRAAGRRQGQAPSLEEPASASCSGEATPTPGGGEARFGAQAGLEVDHPEGGELGPMNNRLGR